MPPRMTTTYFGYVWIDTRTSSAGFCSFHAFLCVCVCVCVVWIMIRHTPHQPRNSFISFIQAHTHHNVDSFNLYLSIYTCRTRFVHFDVVTENGNAITPMNVQTSMYLSMYRSIYMYMYISIWKTRFVHFVEVTENSNAITPWMFKIHWRFAISRNDQLKALVKPVIVAVPRKKAARNGTVTFRCLMFKGHLEPGQSVRDRHPHDTHPARLVLHPDTYHPIRMYPEGPSVIRHI